MANGYKTGGRRPGSKNVKTKEKEDRAARAAVAAAASVLDVKEEAKRLGTIGTVSDDAPEIEKAKAGISAKDLLLTAMRVAWDDAKRLSREADLLELGAAAAESEARDAIAKAASDGSGTTPTCDPKVETAKALRAKVDGLRAEARRQLVASTEWAKDVAPYEHAKVRTQIEGDDKVINVILRQF